MRTIYLDSNATSQPAPEVVEAMNQSLTELWQNPSSVHRPGQLVRRAVEQARKDLASLIGARDREIAFTAGGTEADNWAIFGTFDALPDRRVFVTDRTEHSAVRESADLLERRGVEVMRLPINRAGQVDVGALRELLGERAEEIGLVSIMWGNNETGVIQPVEAIGALCREHGVRFHTDAVQWVGKMPTSVRDLPIDLMSMAAHKFHGPKGVGALYIARGVRLAKWSIGGSQERDRRGGTENVPGIVGMGAAAMLAEAWLAKDEIEQKRSMRDRFEQSILDRLPDTSINGGDAERMWNTSNIAFHRLESEAILLSLSERGVCASGGSACASGSLEPSPVLLAMGIPEKEAHGSIRFSFSRETTEDELAAAADVIVEVIERMRSLLPAV